MHRAAIGVIVAVAFAVCYYYFVLFSIRMHFVKRLQHVRPIRGISLQQPCSIKHINAIQLAFIIVVVSFRCGRTQAQHQNKKMKQHTAGTK